MENNSIYFYKINDPFGFMSNFYKSKFFLYNRNWETVEHAYQAQKTFSQDQYEEILNAKSPKDARLLGQKVSLRYDWEDVKYHVMKDCVFAKFDQNVELRQKLISTNPSLIFEDSPVDAYWGVGPNKDGKNALGKILVEVRDMLFEVL